MKDNNKNTGRSKGVPIRKLNYIMASVTLLVSIVLLFVSYRTISAYNELESESAISERGQRNAQDMQKASDFLTEQARCFVESGKKSYLDAYFEESEVTRRREKALIELGTTFAGTEEYAALEDAEERSMALMDTEHYAMRLAAEAYGYDLSEFPSAIQNTAILKIDAVLPANEKLVKARQMVFNDSYHYQKAIITSKTQECLTRLINKLQKKQTATANQFGVIIRIEQGLILALILIVLIIVALTTTQVIEPLTRAIPHIRGEKPIPVGGAQEFRYLANTYNKMYAENRTQKEELAYEASHDQLTGVFNRKGFEKIMREMDNKKTALLLIDVDCFKTINDTYGHAEGDKVLSRMTGILSSCFRTSDLLCRIGGDEFVLFLPGAGAESREAIGQKIDEVNKALQAGGEGVVATSVSVGVAFGENEDMKSVYNKADVALYKVKENGRCGCAFYE